MRQSQVTQLNSHTEMTEKPVPQTHRMTIHKEPRVVYHEMVTKGKLSAVKTQYKF